MTIFSLAFQVALLIFTSYATFAFGDVPSVLRALKYTQFGTTTTVISRSSLAGTTSVLPVNFASAPGVPSDDSKWSTDEASTHADSLYFDVLIASTGVVPSLPLPPTTQPTATAMLPPRNTSITNGSSIKVQASELPSPAISSRVSVLHSIFPTIIPTAFPIIPTVFPSAFPTITALPPLPPPPSAFLTITALPTLLPPIPTVFPSAFPTITALPPLPPPRGRQLRKSNLNVPGMRVMAHDATILLFNLWLLNSTTQAPLQRGIPSTSSGSSLFFPSGRNDARAGSTSGTAPFYPAGSVQDYLSLGINGIDVSLKSVNWTLVGTPGLDLGLTASNHILTFTSTSCSLLIAPGALRPGFFYKVTASPTITARISASSIGYTPIDVYTGTPSVLPLRIAFLFVHMPPRTLFQASPSIGIALTTSFFLSASAIASKEAQFGSLDSATLLSFFSANAPSATSFTTSPLTACANVTTTPAPAAGSGVAAAAGGGAAAITVIPSWYSIFSVLATTAGLSPATVCTNIALSITAAPLSPSTKSPVVSFRRFSTVAADSGVAAATALVARYDITSSQPDAAAAALPLLAIPGGSGFGDLLSPYNSLPANATTILAGSTDRNVTVIIVAIAVDSDGAAGLDAVALTVQPLSITTAAAATAFVAASAATLTNNSIAENPHGALTLIAALGSILGGNTSTTNTSSSVNVTTAQTAANTAVRSDLIGSVSTALNTLATSSSEGRSSVASDLNTAPPPVTFTIGANGVVNVALDVQNITTAAKAALAADSSIHLGDSTLETATSALALLTAIPSELTRTAAESALATTLALLTLALPTNVLAEAAAGGVGDAAAADAAPVARSFPPAAASAVMSTLANVLFTLPTVASEALPSEAPTAPDDASPTSTPLPVSPSPSPTDPAVASALREQVHASLRGLGAAVLRGARTGDPPISISSGPSSAFEGVADNSSSSSSRRLSGAASSYCGAALSLSSVRLSNNNQTTIALGSPINPCLISQNSTSVSPPPPSVIIPTALIDRLRLSTGTAIDLVLTQTGTTDLPETSGASSERFSQSGSIIDSSSSTRYRNLASESAAEALLAANPVSSTIADLMSSTPLATRVFAISLQTPSGSQLQVVDVNARERVNFSLPLRAGGTIQDVADSLSATLPQKTFFIDCPAPELASANSPQAYNLPWPWIVGTQIKGSMVSVAGSTSLSPVNVSIFAIVPVTYTTSLYAMSTASTAGLPPGLPVSGGFPGLITSISNTLSSMKSTNEPLTVTAPSFVMRVDCSYPIGLRNVTCGPGFYGTRFNFSCPVLREEPYCVWWDANASAFSSVGCTAVESAAEGGAIGCSCDHLTEFSARFAALAAEQKNIFAAAESLGDPSTLLRYPHVPILIGVFVFALGIAGILGSRADARGARVFAQSLAADPEVRSLAALEAAHGRVFILDARLPKEVVDQWLTAAPLGTTSDDVVAEADIGAHELSAFGHASGKVPNLYTASIYLRLAALFEPQRADLHHTGVSVLEKARLNKTTLETIMATLARTPPPPPSPSSSSSPPSLQEEPSLQIRMPSTPPSNSPISSSPSAEPTTQLPTTQATSSFSSARQLMVSARRILDITRTSATDAAAKAASAVSTAIANAQSMSLTFDITVGGSSCARAVRLRGLLVRLFILRLFYNHQWMSILWRFDERAPRVLRVAALSASISLSMFSTAFFYAFSGGKPGSDLPKLTFIEAFFIGMASLLLELPARFVLGYVYLAAAKEHFALTYPALAEDLRRRQLAEQMIDRATRAELEAECGDALTVTNEADDNEEDKAYENKAAGWYDVPVICVRIAPGWLRSFGLHPEQRAAFVAPARVSALEAAARARVRIASYSDVKSTATRSHVRHEDDELAFALEASNDSFLFYLLNKIGCSRAARCSARQKVVVDSSSSSREGATSAAAVPSARTSAGSIECGGAATRSAWLTVLAVIGGCLFYVVLFGMTQPAGATESFVIAFFFSQLFSSIVIAPCVLAAALVYQLTVAPAWITWWYGGKKTSHKLLGKTSLTGRLKHMTLVRAAGAASLLAPDEAMAALSDPSSVAAACSVNTKTDVSSSPAESTQNARDALVFRRFLVAQARSAELARQRRAEVLANVSSNGTSTSARGILATIDDVGTTAAAASSQSLSTRSVPPLSPLSPQPPTVVVPPQEPTVVIDSSLYLDSARSLQLPQEPVVVVDSSLYVDFTADSRSSIRNISAASGGASGAAAPQRPNDNDGKEQRHDDNDGKDSSPEAIVISSPPS